MTKTKKKKTKQKLPSWRWLSFLLLLPLAVLLTIILAYHLALAGKMYRYVSISGVDISALTPLQARQILQQKLFRSPAKEIEIVYQTNRWQIDLASIDFAYDIEQTVGRAFALGRRENFWQNQKSKFFLLKEGKDLPLAIGFDEKSLRRQIATISALIETPLVEPSMQLVGNGQQTTIQINPGNQGRRVDLDKTIKQISRQLSELDSAPLILPIQILSTEINPEQMEKTKQRAESLIGKTLRFKQDGFQREISGQELIDFLSFSQDFATDKIGELINNFKKSLDREPQNAAFQFENNRVVLFRPDRNGQQLLTEEAQLLIHQDLSRLEATSSAEIITQLPIKTIPAAITTASVNNLGIKERLGQGISFFRGSIPNRLHNIQLAAQRLNGILIAPNEVFSFNSALGEVSKNTGYKEAYIISRGRTVLGDGGGVCQVSTTLFRAALNAGLAIVERTAHAYRVAYYEQNAAPGFDATVYEPTVDLKFKNDTPAHILIQTSVNISNQQLTFDLYGTNDGRDAFTSQPRIWDQVPPPEPLYQDDPTLPSGTVKQVDWAAVGAKTSFNYKVIRNKEIIFEKTFYSHFRPWQAVYLRGTGQL